MMDNTEHKIRYQGSLLWLIFWTIVFFPVAIMLFFTGAYFQFHDVTYRLRYDGSRFWLGFWVLVFFPIALILLFCNGAWVTKTDEEETIKTVILR